VIGHKGFNLKPIVRVIAVAIILILATISVSKTNLINQSIIDQDNQPTEEASKDSTSGDTDGNPGFNSYLIFNYSFSAQTINLFDLSHNSQLLTAQCKAQPSFALSLLCSFLC